MRILITGVAGFIGFSIAHSILKNKKNYQITGIDNFDNYYSKKIKNLRIKELKKFKNFLFIFLDIRNKKKIDFFFKKKKYDIVIHMAAQAGVRYSQENPKKYIDANIFGFVNLLENLKKNKPRAIFYASSSSIYGDQKIFPIKENFKFSPKNIYASSKVLNELTAKIYSYYYNMKFIGLRFFTVYGEWGRPDMFLFKLFKSEKNKQTFYLNNSGKHKRDFTYIKDVTNIFLILLKKINLIEDNLILNICSNKPIKINDIINFYKKKNNLKIKKIKKNILDVNHTHGSNKLIKKFTNFNKFTSFKNGVESTRKWFFQNKIDKII